MTATIKLFPDFENSMGRELYLNMLIQVDDDDSLIITKPTKFPVFQEHKLVKQCQETIASITHCNVESDEIRYK